MLKPFTHFVIAILTVLLSAQLCFSAQTSVRKLRAADLNAQLEDVNIQTQSVTSFFAELSSFYEIPIGLELASNENESALYYVELKKGTLAEVLTRFVAQYTQYAWKIEDGVVNVFPKEGYRDLMSKELLAVRIESLSIQEKTDCWSFIASLLDRPEAKAILDANDTTYDRRSPGGFYIQNLGRNFTLDVSDLPLRSILNKVISESPTAKFWVVTRNPDRRLFMHIPADPEDAIKIDKREFKKWLNALSIQ